MKKYSLINYCVLGVVLSIAFSFNKPTNFTSAPISKTLMKAMEEGNTWSKDALVPIQRLRLLTVQHIDFNNQPQIGEIIVLDVCEEAVLNIFKILYEKRFPIHQIKPMHYYNGDDHAALAANNTSCYIDRNVIGSLDTPKKSLHAYGLAIDINPIQNPFVTIDKEKGIASYDPIKGIDYANRMESRLGKNPRLGMAEEIIDVFAANGFYWWGGYWDFPIDYQHFQISSLLAELYLSMPTTEAKSVFNAATAYYNTYKKPLETQLLTELINKHKDITTLAGHYQKDKKFFYECLNKLTTQLQK